MATILVVDDEPTILEAVAGVLADDGHAVLVATDGEAARQLLAATIPDLVVTDTMMPRLDGPGLVRWMRSRPDLRHVPVVLTSAAPPPQLTGLGPISFVAKPFDLDALLRSVAQAIASEGTGAGSVAYPAPASGAASETEPGDGCAPDLHPSNPEDMALEPPVP